MTFNPHQLKHLRRTLKLTQEQMADELGIKRRMYIYIESGKSPLSKASEKLAEKLKDSLGGDHQ